MVVVGELLARLDIARGADPDRAADDLRVAVRLAGMIDEARVVAVNIGIAHPSGVDREAPDLAALEVLGFALQAFLVVDQLTGVIDDARVLVDRLEREHAPAMQLRVAPRDTRRPRFPRHVRDRIANGRIIEPT